MATTASAESNILELADGSFGVMITIAGLTEGEARTLGDMLHDPVTKALALAVKDRLTDESHHLVSTRGTTQ